MTHSNKSQPHQKVSPLRQRMIDDMTLRQLAPKTQSGYLRAVKNFTRFFGQSPDKATDEDLRLFQLDMVARGTSAGSINATLSGLHFFFDTTLGHPELLSKMSTVREPRKQPNILSQSEVSTILQATASIKYRAAFAVAYGAGLRITEIARLKISDIDSNRMTIRVELGKGSRDRIAMLSPTLLTILRHWWKIGFAKKKVFRSGWLFPGQDPVNHISQRQLSRVCHNVAKETGIHKKITMHIFRHSFATHLLEQGVDIRVIQKLLGHKQLDTTAHYSQVASHIIRETKSPLDQLLLDIRD